MLQTVSLYRRSLVNAVADDDDNDNTILLPNICGSRAFALYSNVHTHTWASCLDFLLSTFTLPPAFKLPVGLTIPVARMLLRAPHKYPSLYSPMYLQELHAFYTPPTLCSNTDQLLWSLEDITSCVSKLMWR